jgi:hypothetical protein
VAVRGNVNVAPLWNYADVKIVNRNITFRQAGAELCVHMGQAGTPYLPADRVNLLGTASDGDKWGDDPQPKGPGNNMAFAMSWLNRVVPGGGEFQIVICGGNPVGWEAPETGIDAMNCSATTSDLSFAAAIYESWETIKVPKRISGKLQYDFRGGVVIDGEPVVKPLTATNYEVTIRLKNPSETSRIDNGGFAMYGDIDVVDHANFGEVYDRSQGFLFKYNEEVFWRFIVRWTDGLGSHVDASGWWFGRSADLNTANRWLTPSTVPSEHGDYAMAVSWQNLVFEPGGEKTIVFIVGSGYRGYNQPMPSPTPTSSVLFLQSLYPELTKSLTQTSEVTHTRGLNVSDPVDPSELTATRLLPTVPPVTGVLRSEPLSKSDGPTLTVQPGRPTEAEPTPALEHTPTKAASIAEHTPTKAASIVELTTDDDGAVSTIPGSLSHTSDDDGAVSTIPGHTSDEPAGWGKEDWRLWTVVGTVIGVVTALVVVSIIAVLRRRKNTTSSSSDSKGAESNLTAIDRARQRDEMRQVEAGSTTYTQENPLFQRDSEGSTSSNMFLSDEGSTGAPGPGPAPEDVSTKSFFEGRRAGHDLARQSESAKPRKKLNADIADAQAEVRPTELDDDPHHVAFAPEYIVPDPHEIEPGIDPPEAVSLEGAAPRVQEVPKRRIPNTFESEPDPECPPALAPGRLLNIPAAVSSSAVPGATMSSAPKPLPGEAPVRWHYDIDLGSFESMCGEPATHRLMFPVANANRGKVQLEQEVAVAEILGVTAAAGHLQITVTAGHRIGGSYPVKVVVECRGKTMVGKADIIIKHNKAQTLSLSAPVGGRSDAPVPYTGQLWKAATFTAHFEPPLKEFAVTNASGSMNAGAKFFPFQIVFTPKDTKSVTALLVVVFDAAEEHAIEVVGSVGQKPAHPQAQYSAE